MVIQTQPMSGSLIHPVLQTLSQMTQVNGTTPMTTVLVITLSSLTGKHGARPTGLMAAERRWATQRLTGGAVLMETVMDGQTLHRIG
tara:strand:- start:1012 stop:1272 length:261 start_codon:yes stop_codon:yes gene_type:complete